MIEVSPGIFYDPSQPWYFQSADCIALGEEVIQNQTPKTTNYETAGANTRLLSGVWDYSSATGNFEMTLTKHYLYPIETPAFMAKSAQDTVTVIQL